MDVKRTPEAARSVLAKRRAEAESRAKDHMEILRASAAMRRHQSVSEALQRILLRGNRFFFDVWADLMEPQPWATNSEGQLLGHLLTVDEPVFDDVATACQVELLPIADALDREWAEPSQRSSWADTYAGALRSLADRAEQKEAAMQHREQLERALERPAQSLGEEGQR